MRRAKPKPRQREHAEQAALVTWAGVTRFPNPPCPRHPKLGDYLFAIPNGGHRSIAEASRLKAEGVKAGVSDLFLALPRSGYAGLWVEMKSPAGSATKAGVASPAQREWRDLMLASGYLAVVCAGWDAARGHIERYVGL